MVLDHNNNMNTSGLDLSKLKIPSTGGTVDVNNTDLGSVITSIIPYLFGAAGIMLLIYLILAGFQFMTSRGDPKATQAAQSKITNAVIGFVIIFSSYLIVRLVEQLLGLKGTGFGQAFGN